MKNLSKSEIADINGGCFSYYAGWFLREVVGSATSTPSGEGIARAAVHHATCDH